MRGNFQCRIGEAELASRPLATAKSFSYDFNSCFNMPLTPKEGKEEIHDLLLEIGVFEARKLALVGKYQTRLSDLAVSGGSHTAKFQLLRGDKPAGKLFVDIIFSRKLISAPFVEPLVSMDSLESVSSDVQYSQMDMDDIISAGPLTARGSTSRSHRNLDIVINSRLAYRAGETMKGSPVHSTPGAHTESSASRREYRSPARRFLDLFLPRPKQDVVLSAPPQPDLLHSHLEKSHLNIFKTKNLGVGPDVKYQM
ncbi:MAG: uncharacterized protein KVP18_003739 [Porospora cf. gigantea A]|uniref:uncharacterized protein n=1 Tax=Porospora cf. gigantea A TaxID=2853593 RepID=UPI0035597B5B|nr:MAG: hypothetical protein KVP18_003739 [Porospora cf. gigantea A]